MATIIQKDFSASGQNANLGLRMQQYPFIFSDEKRWKLKRHISFWFWWWAFQSFLYSFVAYNMQLPYFNRMPL
jgi:hypothetical protein